MTFFFKQQKCITDQAESNSRIRKCFAYDEARLRFHFANVLVFVVEYIDNVDELYEHLLF